MRLTSVLPQSGSFMNFFCLMALVVLAEFGVSVLQAASLENSTNSIPASLANQTAGFRNQPTNQASFTSAAEAETHALVTSNRMKQALIKREPPKVQLRIHDAGRCNGGCTIRSCSKALGGRRRASVFSRISGLPNVKDDAGPPSCEAKLDQACWQISQSPIPARRDTCGIQPENDAGAGEPAPRNQPHGVSVCDNDSGSGVGLRSGLFAAAKRSAWRWCFAKMGIGGGVH
jgi:hypothetical protein